MIVFFISTFFTKTFFEGSCYDLLKKLHTYQLTFKILVGSFDLYGQRRKAAQFDMFNPEKMLSISKA